MGKIKWTLAAIMALAGVIIGLSQTGLFALPLGLGAFSGLAIAGGSLIILLSLWKFI